MQKRFFNQMIFSGGCLSWAAALFTCFACEDSGKVEFDDVPVVEAYLHENAPISLKISRKAPFAEGVQLDPKDLDQLDVRIQENEREYTLLNKGGGLYQGADPKNLVREGKTYRLSFSFKGKTINAETQVLSKPEGFKQGVLSLKVPQITFPPSGGLSFPDPVKFSWKNPDRTYYLLVIENMERNPERTINIDFGGEEPPRLFRIEPTQNDNLELRSQQFQYYGRHRIILYHINPEYALLYEDTGNNSINLQAPPSNVRNGLGIFTAISSDTLFLDVYK
jgi:Domain of unknown function (DUF4249)